MTANPSNGDSAQPLDGRVLDRLSAVIDSRRGADPAHSYSARMLAKGRGKIAQKVGEEAVETVIAALHEDHHQVVYESTDLLYHLLLLWAEVGVDPAEVWAEVVKRHPGPDLG